MRIDSVTPAVGSTTVPTTVVIVGDGFKFGATVTVGNALLKPSTITPLSLVVSVPPQPQGAHVLVVTNPDGRSVRREDGFRFEAGPQTSPTAGRVTGQLVADGSDVPFAGAAMRLQQDFDLARPPAITDEDGRFTLTGVVAPEVEQLVISVTAPATGARPWPWPWPWPWPKSWSMSVSREKTDPVVLRVPDLSFIRAGMTWRGVIASGPDQTECTFESVPCHPLVVQGARGALIELELTPDNGQTVGLILSDGVMAPRDFPTRLTVEPGPMWIMGGFGAFTLRAR